MYAVPIVMVDEQSDELVDIVVVGHDLQILQPLQDDLIQRVEHVSLYSYIHTYIHTYINTFTGK